MLILFWSMMIITLIIYFISLKHKKAEKILPFPLLLAGSFMIAAIITKDPIFSAIGVPAEFEWVVGLFLTGFSSWKLYFSPLKERVISTEKEIGSIKTSVERIEKNVDMLTNKILNEKVECKKKII
ncbi:hypothetical protein HZB88_00795 [archaeon]|nr:hypothetical protein [archaeon]